MVTCRACQIVLPEGTERCPACQRNLRVPRWLILAVLGFGVLSLFVLLAGSNRIKKRIQSWRVSPDVVLKATEALVARNPAVHNPLGFSAMEQSSVEHWDAYRWRVSGFVDTKKEGGGRLRTLYFAVVQQAGNEWNLEDLQLQHIDSGPPGKKK